MLNNLSRSIFTSDIFLLFLIRTVQLIPSVAILLVFKTIQEYHNLSLSNDYVAFYTQPDNKLALYNKGNKL